MIGENFRFRTSGISSLSVCLKFILNWIWPRDRCAGGGEPEYWRRRAEHWLPDADDRSLGSIHRTADGRFVLRASITNLSHDSSSDDGGFAPRRPARASWRKPLVGYPSQLSLRSDGSGQSARVALPALVYRPQAYALSPRFRASSPAIVTSPFLSPVHFSDLSSVRQPSSAERSFPTPPTAARLRSVHQRYSQELPSLRAIREEARVPRPRSPRRLARSAPDLARHHSHEPSPESRSSSSGFGSKNTSSQQNQSSRSGSTGEWLLPPYRAPPQPPPPLWLELALLAPLAPAPPKPASGDAGSVDAHYEFDPATPTPSASTPTELRPRMRRERDVEARVRAMKEEFYQFRRRQAQRLRERDRDLDSVC